jgi:dTDP-4-dehydrorhamnose 3,5-epimerase
MEDQIMNLKIESHHLNGVVVIVPEVFQDDRGFFMETFRTDQFKQLGLPSEFVQDNHSGSVKDVLRGQHFQWDPPMGKLIRVTKGTAFLTAVDIRKGSPSLGQWMGFEVSAENKKMIWAPAGFARGFLSLSDYVELQYKCTGIYNSLAEASIKWDDPDIGIKWPVKNPIISQRDIKAQSFKDWLKTKESNNFTY